MNVPPPPRVALRALGCRLNEAELETWARQLQAHGCRIVRDDEEADLVIFNSCAVTGDAVRKSRNLLRRAARQNPRAKLVLSGCYASLEPDEAKGLGVDLVVANADKDRLVELARRELDLFAEPAAATEPGESALHRLGRHRAFVKVQDGCRHRCTFCIVTVARGEERSRSIADIVDEIDTHQRQGLQEVVLTGVHLGGYGGDSGSSLAELIGTILERTEIPRVRLGSLEPWDLPEGFADLFGNPRLMPHLHLPLQSGSDSVLKRMARRCRTGDFAALLERLRAAIPDLNVTTDIIVGFPGESEAEWSESLAFIDAMDFGHIHAFAFSPRAGTAAARMADPVPAEVKKQRGRALHDLAERQRRTTLEQYLGRRFPVLWEGARPGPDGNPWIFGYTPNYLKVGLPEPPGDPVSYRVTPTRLKEVDASGEYLRGKIDCRREGTSAL
jgi:threonylcarbamoyladenosine tRNA methylthiotransferase MtaB